MIKTASLPEETWEIILEILESHQDEGPEGEGWKSDELISAIGALQESLQTAAP